MEYTIILRINAPISEIELESDAEFTSSVLSAQYINDLKETYIDSKICYTKENIERLIELDLSDSDIMTEASLVLSKYLTHVLVEIARALRDVKLAQTQPFGVVGWDSGFVVLSTIHPISF